MLLEHHCNDKNVSLMIIEGKKEKEKNREGERER